MKKTNLLYIAILCAVSFSVHAQDTAKAILWRGFDHRWTYNHRLNRLGSYVARENGTNYCYHASATGLGADSCYFSEFYTTIASPELRFVEGTQNFALDAREGAMVAQTIEVKVPFKEDPTQYNKYITLLNGFDLVARRRADKLQMLRIFVEDPQYEPEIKQLRFKIHVSMVSDCSTAECPKFVQKAFYSMKVNFLIIAGHEGLLQEQSHLFYNDYLWSKKNEIYETPMEGYVVGDNAPVFDKAAIGIKSMEISLDREHWLVEWSHKITPLRYDAARGEMKLAINLFFKEWELEMKRFSAFPKLSRFSSKRSGWITTSCQVALLQFHNATICNGACPGKGFWRGHNGKANSGSALYKRPAEGGACK